MPEIGAMKRLAPGSRSGSNVEIGGRVQSSRGESDAKIFDRVIVSVVPRGYVQYLAHNVGKLCWEDSISMAHKMLDDLS